MHAFARLICLVVCILAALVGGGVITSSVLSVDWLIPVALLFGFYSCPIGPDPQRWP
jgi:hypothetical protein